jgi:Short C-terminal domain
MVAGFIQFTMPGGSERRSKFGSQSSDAAKDENTVMFTKAQMPQFLALRDEIEQAITARSAPPQPAAPPPVAPNPVEQIQQLASLRDQGILSQEEFDAKKSELLSRM